MYRQIRNLTTMLSLSAFLALAVPLGAHCADTESFVRAESVVLTKVNGTINGPSGKETYYNLNMTNVIKIMRNLGYDAEEYPYWVRDDGVKMFGPYVMVAANLVIRPRGTIVQTSLGKGIVVDTGEFAKYDTTQIDIAVTW